MKMKKIYTMMMMAMMALVLSSCNEDQQIANTLEGTWQGNMYVSSNWNGRTYNATYTEITFLRDPYRYSSGSGYWVDYYSNAPWDYVANHIEWRVDFGVIKVYFVEEDTSLEIRNYRLNLNRFYGTIYEADNTVDFEMANISRPVNYYDNYGWGYSYWNGYYSRGTRSADSDSVSTEKPRRFINPELKGE